MKDTEVNIAPFAYVIRMVNGKWKMHILFWLWKKGTLRYGELKRALGPRFRRPRFAGRGSRVAYSSQQSAAVRGPRSAIREI